MKWYIKLYKNLPNELKEDCKRKSGLYIVRHWNEHCTSICLNEPLGIGAPPYLSTALSALHHFRIVS